MRHSGQCPCPFVDQAFYARLHAVEGLRSKARFGRAGLGKRWRVEVATERIGGLSELFQRLGCLADGNHDDGSNDDQRDQELDDQVVGQSRGFGLREGRNPDPLAINQTHIEAAHRVAVLLHASRAAMHPAA